MNRLWYKQPAEYWEAALPLGNGRIGAMVYGGVGKERIELNEDTLWTGKPVEVNAYQIPENIDDVRALIKDHKYTEACHRTDEMMARHDVQAYQLAGNVYLDFNTDDICEEYSRELDLNSAMTTVRYKKGDTVFKREMFVSEPHQTVCVRITSEKENKLSFKISTDSLLKHNVKIENNECLLEGACPLRNATRKSEAVWEENGKSGVPYVVKTRVISSDGEIDSDSKHIIIKNSSEVLLYIAVQTGFISWDRDPNIPIETLIETCDNQLNKAEEMGWEDLYEDHYHEYTSYYSKLKLDLKALDERTTDEILKENKEASENIALTNLVFNYGRYLLIASSRPGTQPANLQGVWNDKAIPVWRSDYHTNINLQMNYWLSDSCNLSECAEPLLKYIKDLSIAGKESAKKIYGARGWCMHHCGDIWRYTQTAGSCSNFSLWPFGGAWLCQHIWESYAFSHDKNFLVEYFPVLKEAALFFVDFLIKNEDGKLTSSPSCSPENSFIDPQTGKSVGLCEGSAMD